MALCLTFAAVWTVEPPRWKILKGIWMPLDRQKGSNLINGDLQGHKKRI